MDPAFDLALVDADGAIREAEDAVGGDTRADFFRKAAIGGGAAIGSASIMGMLPEIAAARPSKKQDIRILNFALTLEYLEGDFYAEAVDSGVLSGNTATVARMIRDHEKAHVDAIAQTIKKLGGRAVRRPKFNFQGTNTDADKFIETAFVLENTGVRAYLGQAHRLKSRALLKAAASIVTIEARHAAAIAVLLNEPNGQGGGRDNAAYTDGERGITPYGSFDRRSRKKTILREVESTGFIEG